MRFNEEIFWVISTVVIGLATVGCMWFGVGGYYGSPIQIMGFIGTLFCVTQRQHRTMIRLLKLKE